VPSTVRSATIGGFIAGGSGGIGSLRWGFLRDAGNLLGLEVVTLEPEPRLLQLDAAASAPLNHAYGTNGILTALRLPTTEAVAWQQLVVGFEQWDRALAAAQALPATALQLNAITLLEAPVAHPLPWPAGCPAPNGGEHRLLLLAAPDALEVLPDWLAARGGALRWQAPQGQSRGLPLRELSWNHTTLHWRSQHKGWTYLQMLLPQPEGSCLERLRSRWGDDLLWHLEAVKQQGAARLAALPLVRWRGEQALEQLMADCREAGAVLFNPHVLTVEDGGLGVVDADQVAAKAAYDPLGFAQSWQAARLAQQPRLRRVSTPVTGLVPSASRQRERWSTRSIRASLKSASVTVAPRKLLPEAMAPLSTAPVRSAPDRSTLSIRVPLRSAPAKLASGKAAWVRIAPCRLAPLKLACRPVAPAKEVLARFWPLKSCSFWLVSV
jgi:hypothetical protein